MIACAENGGRSLIEQINMLSSYKFFRCWRPIRTEKLNECPIRLRAGLHSLGCQQEN